MKSKTSRRLLDRSCGWIRDHWNAQNLDVPNDLLAEWIYNVEGQDEDPCGFHLAVFSFGYLQHDLISHNVPPGVKRSFAASELIDLFHAWQLKLALAEIHRRTSLRVNPLPLFAFSNDERVDAWIASATSDQCAP